MTQTPAPTTHPVAAAPAAQAPMAGDAGPLAALADARTVVLTTFRRDGTPVPTAMSIVVDGDRAFMRTWATSGKAKRLRHTPVATVAESTLGGRPTGPAVDVRTRFVEDADARRASRLIASKHRVLHGVAVPIVHRLTRRRPVYIELVAATPAQGPAGSAAARARQGG